MSSAAATRAFPLDSDYRRRLWRRHLIEARRPLNVLLFLAPLVAVYELHRVLLTQRGETVLLAPTLIVHALEWFGVTGLWAPPAMFLVIMIVWHRRRKDRWRWRGWLLPGMAGESVVAAIPLLVLGLMFQTRDAYPGTGPLGAFAAACGAGVYEELLFRLLLIGGLTAFLSRGESFPDRAVRWSAVGISAVVFAACHFEPVAAEAWGVQPFLFRVVAGVYLGWLYLRRSLGIAAGCHVAFNAVQALWAT